MIMEDISFILWSVVLTSPGDLRKIFATSMRNWNEWQLLYLCEWVWLEYLVLQCDMKQNSRLVKDLETWWKLEAGNRFSVVIKHEQNGLSNQGHDSSDTWKGGGYYKSWNKTSNLREISSLSENKEEFIKFTQEFLLFSTQLAIV